MQTNKTSLLYTVYQKLKQCNIDLYDSASSFGNVNWTSNCGLLTPTGYFFVIKNTGKIYSLYYYYVLTKLLMRPIYCGIVFTIHGVIYKRNDFYQLDFGTLSLFNDLC